MSFNVQYLGKIDFIFKVNIEYDIRGLVDTFDEKNKLKNLMKVYLKGTFS
jgi:hypothetical protein